MEVASVAMMVMMVLCSDIGKLPATVEGKTKRVDSGA